MRRGRDSNPRAFRLPAFQAGALGHYATSPTPGLSGVSFRPVAGSAPLVAWLLLTIALASALSYVLIFRRDLVKGKPAPTAPPPYLPVLGWLLASVAVVLFIFLVLVVIGTS